MRPGLLDLGEPRETKVTISGEFTGDEFGPAPLVIEMWARGRCSPRWWCWLRRHEIHETTSRVVDVSKAEWDPVRGEMNLTGRVLNIDTPMTVRPR